MKNLGFNLYKHLRETVSEAVIEKAAIVKMPAPIKLNESKHIVRPPVLKPAKTQVNESFFKEVLAEVVDNKISLSDIYDILPASSPNLVKSVLKMLAEEGVEVTNEGKIPSKPAEVTEETRKSLLEKANLKANLKAKQIAKELSKKYPKGLPFKELLAAINGDSNLGPLVISNYKKEQTKSSKIGEALGNKETVLGEFSDEQVAKAMAKEKNGTALLNPETKKWKVIVKEAKKVEESIQATIQTDTETIKVASDETGTKITTVDANDKETTIKVPKVEEPVAAPEVEVTPPAVETPIDSKEPEVEVKPKEEEPIEEHKLKESYGMQSIIGDISRGMPKEEVIKKLQSRYPDITDESALEIYGDAKAGNSNSQGWLRKKKDVKESKEQNDEFQELLAQYHDAIDARDREKVKALGAQIDQLIGKVTETEKELKESKFQVGEVVWYEGKKWEIADHTKGQYLLWSPGKEHKEEIEDWIPQDYLAKVRESLKETVYSTDDGWNLSKIPPLRNFMGAYDSTRDLVYELRNNQRSMTLVEMKDSLMDGVTQMQEALEEIEDGDTVEEVTESKEESKKELKESGDDFTLGFAESVVQSLKDVLGVEVKLEKAISKLKGMDRVGLTSLKTAVETQDAGTLKTFLNMILENKGA